MLSNERGITVSVNPEHCSKQYVADELFGMAAILEQVMSERAMQMAGEAKSMEALILATSPDRLDNPRVGEELWQHLKAEFPDGQGGISVANLVRAMAREFMAVLLR